jgi:predicted NBD/HSP70 family sugar kinase
MMLEKIFGSTGGGALGIDIGASKIEWALLEGGKIKKTQKFQTPKGMDNAALMKIIYNIIEATKPGKIAIAAPGYCRDGEIINLPNIPKVGSLLVEKGIKKQFGIDAFLQNDVKCASLAQWWMRGKRGDDSFVMVAPGSGIGGAIVYNGMLMHGQSNVAGEFGHMKICVGCGRENKWVEWEEMCGGRGIEKKYLEIGGRKIADGGKGKKFGKKCGGDANKMQADAKFILNSNDELAKKVSNDGAYYFGVGLANLANALNPKEIIIAGSVGKAYFAKYKGQMMAGFGEAVIKPVRNTKIRISEFENPALMGAMLLAKQDAQIRKFLNF